jgi:hypothetical protein
VELTVSPQTTIVHADKGLLTFAALATLSATSRALAYNEQTGEVGYYPITAFHEYPDPVTINLTIDNDPTDDQPGLVLETTPEHPFYVNNTWACPECAEWVNAEDLTVGTVLTSFDGENGIIPLGTITATERIEQEQVMYNLTVDTANTFFVGEQGWLVHNAGPCQKVFAPGQWLSHFQKHTDEFPEYATSVEYLRGAQKLTDGGNGIYKYTRANGDTLWYNPSTNEFAALRPDGQTIKTYFKPEGPNPYQYWLNNTGGTGGVATW